FCATVPLKRYAVCGTTASRDQSDSSERSRTSTPSSRTSPDVTSKPRVMRFTIVLFPEPVPPMTLVAERPRLARKVAQLRDAQPEALIDAEPDLHARIVATRK